jgi:flavin reductase (DIM6/NTAB) family NADH-FMN oxidoreductase RutF
MLKERRESMEEQMRSEILKTIPYGFYITGVVGSDGEANGFTTCWVSQVSFEPQQVVVAVRKDHHTHDLIEARWRQATIPSSSGKSPPPTSSVPPIF